MTDYEAFLAQHQADIEAMEMPGAYGQYVHVPHVQLRFLRLCRPEPFEDGSMVKHSAEIIVDKETDSAAVQDIEDAIQYVFSQALSDYLTRYPARQGKVNGVSCVHDGDVASVVGKYLRNRYVTGKIYFTARNRRMPITVDANGDYLPPENVNEADDASVILWFYSYTRLNKSYGDTIGVGCILVAIQQPGVS